ncbi:alpha-E domain-containing protein [Bacillus sp. N1-1]|jgi:uncharacterized alpha-E superfamily protein|uniref:alpha-E domain-containing protein n=1 Tax=Bacillus sp. N1-1 TaxID=2682541 RepID=UPI0013183FA1|nr:alpha-E domain-containing protein [Bacillus sp. N1-1]QHA93431.1 alpha-E domain-containing protein [Bacillus sp. N1-1]
MLSRVADSLYWLTRNVERAENNARLIAVKLTSRLENANPIDETNQNWYELIEISGFKEVFDEEYQHPMDRNVMEFLLFSLKNPNSILNTITIARENARAVREIIPNELWESINSYYLKLKKQSHTPWTMEEVSDICEFVKKDSLLFQGIVEATMPRGDAYLFMEMGKHLERAEKAARILDVYYHKDLECYQNKEIVEYHHWWSVLQSVSGHEAYIKTYRPLIKSRNVAEFFILNAEFPRSMMYCVQKVRNAFVALEDGHVEHYSESLAQELEHLANDLYDFSIEEILNQGAHAFLQSFQHRCMTIGMHITKTYYLGEVVIP